MERQNARHASYARRCASRLPSGGRTVWLGKKLERGGEETHRLEQNVSRLQGEIGKTARPGSSVEASKACLTSRRLPAPTQPPRLIGTSAVARPRQASVPLQPGSRPQALASHSRKSTGELPPQPASRPASVTLQAASRPASVPPQPASRHVPPSPVSKASTARKSSRRACPLRPPKSTGKRASKARKSASKRATPPQPASRTSQKRASTARKSTGKRASTARM